MQFPKTVLVIFALALLLRAFPVFIGSMSGPDPWFHARMSEMVVESQAVPTYDELSMQGRHYSYAPLFHVLIASFSIFSSVNVLSLAPLLPVLYGGIAVLLAFAFARRLFQSNSVALFAALAIAVMPLHLLRTAAYARPDGLALLLVPTIILLVYMRRFFPAGLLAVALALLHPLSSLYLSLFLVAWMLVARFRRLPFEFSKCFAVILLGVLVWLLWVYSSPYAITEYVSAVSLESAENYNPTLLNFFTFFTFSWVFILIGLTKLDSRKNLFLLTWFLFSLLYGAFSFRLAIFLTVPAALIAAHGFGIVFEKTRRFFPVLVFLLFALALLVVVDQAESTGYFVSPAERRAMSWLANTPQGSVIASQWDRGHPLAYLARRQVFIDGYFEFAPRLDERNESMKVLMVSSDCSKLLAEKERWGIDYFFVHKSALDSPAYRHGLLEASCPFISRVYSSDYAQVLGFA